MLVYWELVSESLFVFGLFFFHNDRRMLALGKGHFFVVGKLELHL